MPKDIEIHVKRQDTPVSPSYWEEYVLPYQPRQNVISVLMELAKDSRTKQGKPTSPVVYDRACLEEVCGSCAMRINGVSRMACTALIDALDQPIRLEPMAKFPVRRDLAVDRQPMFDALKRVKAWIPIDGTYDLGPGPRMPEAEQALAKSIPQRLRHKLGPLADFAESFVAAGKPSDVPLTTAIAEMYRATTLYGLKKLFGT